MELNTEERLAWWHEARYGMFIHWGLYASLAGEWKGRKTTNIAEWIMRDLQIPVADYERIAETFNPVKYDAEAWAQLAEDAGMKYVVITAKHHDGFCMFAAETNPYNIVRCTPFGRDPMMELSVACGKRGIKMCFYYSQAQDWHAKGGAGHWEEENSDSPGYTRPMRDFQQYLDNIVKPDLKDLLSKYGPIGLIWFDTPMVITAEQSQALKDTVHTLQPECLVSGRVGHGVGDYGCLGDNEHPGGQVVGAWETPATLNDTWGFNKDDHNWKSLEFVLELLINCASKGVNYLLNVGPTDEGVIPEPSCIILRQVGEWLKTNGEAIYGTKGSPFPVDEDWGRVTRKDNHIYLILKQDVKEVCLPGLNNAIVSARNLGSDEATVSYRREGDFVVVRTSHCSEELYHVVALELDGPPDVEQSVIQSGMRPIVLPIHLCDLTGDATILPRGATSKWLSTDIRAQWKLRVGHPGEYGVVVQTFGRRRVPDGFGNHEVQVSIGNQKVSGIAGVKDLDMRDDAPGPQKPESAIGVISIDNAGEHQLEIVVTKLDKDARQGFNLVAVKLIP